MYIIIYTFISIYSSVVWSLNGIWWTKYAVRKKGVWLGKAQYLPTSSAQRLLQGRDIYSREMIAMLDDLQ